MVSVSASEAACGFSTGVADFPDRISSFLGDEGEKGASRDRTLGAVLLVDSGSSAMVSLDTGRVVLAAALRDVTLSGDVAASIGVVDTVVPDEGRGWAVEDVAMRGRVEVLGLAVPLVALDRDESVVGLLGGAEAALLPPNVVRRVVVAAFSVRDSGLAVLELKELVVGVVALANRLFSSFGAASLSDSVVVLRTVEDTGRVGGLVIVVPLARDDNALVRLVVEGDVVVREDGALSLSVTDSFFLVPSSDAVLDALAVGVLLGGFLSMFLFGLLSSSTLASQLVLGDYNIRRRCLVLPDQVCICTMLFLQLKE